MNKISKLFHQLFKLIGPIKEIVYFLFLFLFFELLWKLCIHEFDDDNQMLFVLGTNLTSLVYPICLWTAKVSYWVIHNLLGYESFHINNLYIYFDNSLKLKIIWGCTGVKQMLQFIFILCFIGGPWKKKLTFIPISLIILSLINFIRLIATSFILKDGFPDWFILFNETFNHVEWNNTTQTYLIFYKDWFHLFHDTIFKWVYFDGVMFLLWLFWQEKINRPYQEGKLNAK